MSLLLLEFFSFHMQIFKKVINIIVDFRFTARELFQTRLYITEFDIR